MLPQIDSTSSINIQKLTIVPFPSRTHKLHQELIIGYVDGLKAIEQYVFHCLNTERYAYTIYSPNYGAEFQKYVGKDFSFVQATISDTIRDALMQDDRIIDVRILSVEKTGLDSMEIKFTVFCNLGTFESSVILNV
jgi:hypothetical protein